MPRIKRLSSPIFFSQSLSNIDTENGIINGITIVQAGEAQGHGYFLNDTFIKRTAELGAEFGQQGVKCRFGHPNMCSNALGTYLGRFKNFRYDADQQRCVADLFLDESAKITPNGNLYDYVLTRAKTSPDHFGNSIVFHAGDPEISEIKNEAGDVVESKEFATIEKLTESDLVDSPAATPSLFSRMNGGEIAAQVTEFLDTNPELFAIIEKNPDIIDEFLEKYTNYKQLQISKMNNAEARNELSRIELAFKAIARFFKLEADEPINTGKIICPSCEAEIDTTTETPDTDGNYTCPKCQAVISPDGKLVKEAPTKEPEQPTAEQEKIIQQQAEIDDLKTLAAKQKELLLKYDASAQEFYEMKAAVEKSMAELAELKTVLNIPERQANFDLGNQTTLTPEQAARQIKERKNKK